MRQFCAHWQGPGPSAVLCSEHFTPDCMLVRENRYEERLTGNRPCYRQLVDGAIPSIVSETSKPAVTPKARRKCDATTKRDGNEVSPYAKH